MHDDTPSEPLSGSGPHMGAAPVAGAGAWSDPAASTPSKPPKKGWKTWVAAGAVALVIAGGGGLAISRTGDPTASASTATAAGAAGTTGRQGVGQPGGMGTSGTIAAVDGSTLTVATTATDQAAASTVTVTTSDATTYSETADGTVADLATGDNVRVMGATTDAGVTAERIVDSGDVAATDGPGGGGAPPAAADGNATGADASGSSTAAAGAAPTGAAPTGGQGGPGGGTSGTITAIDGDTVTVETADGTSVTVTITDDTAVSVQTEIALSDLAAGDTVSVMGTTTDATVAATSIRKGELGGAGAGATAIG